jgi:ribulose-phosphate 3-epimerase
MTVHPGFSGQTFIKKPLQKIAEARKYNPTIIIGVDGGINHTTCRMASREKANFAIATSDVTKAQNPKKSYKELTKCA